MITLLMMTDGRADCLTRTANSLRQHLRGPLARGVIHTDGGDPDYDAWLDETFPDWTVVSTGTRSGFAGAYRSAWSFVRDHVTTPWVFSTEDDFLLTGDLHLADLINVMAGRPNLAQMALLRQPWNRTEQEAGGIIECHPDDYADATDGVHHWLEHRRFFTTNPHLIAADFIRAHDWPTGEHSEGRFGVDLFATEPFTRAAFWGRRHDAPRVRHIGVERVGTGY